jgi:DNA-binding CsgD family transcriptional regulator
VARTIKSQHVFDDLSGLNLRQKEVLRHIAEGLTGREIGDLLNISHKTVEYHRTALSKILGFHSTALLSRIAMQCGLVGAVERPEDV